jgi:hypothetical protein
VDTVFIFDGFVRGVTGDHWSHVLEEAILPLNAAGLYWPIRFPTYINMSVIPPSKSSKLHVSYIAMHDLSSALKFVRLQG